VTVAKHDEGHLLEIFWKRFHDHALDLLYACEEKDVVLLSQRISEMTGEMRQLYTWMYAEERN